MSLERRDGVTSVKINHTTPGREVAFESTYSGTTIKTKILPDGPEVSAEVAAGSVIWENLLWTAMADVGRRLAADAEAGKLSPGAVVPIVAPGSLRGFEIKLAEFWPSPQTVKGKSARCWGFKVELAGTEMILICSPKGVPLRQAVPAQTVDVVLEGFEEVEIPPLQPVSIVDKGPWRRKLSEPKQKVTVEKKVMIPMRDGVKLAADLTRPEGGGKVPAILIRTPYGRAAEALTKGSYYAPRGYAVVAQDCRGRFDSEGTFFPIKNETDDGSDTLDWIAAQPWCDGNIGMIGASYVGWVQWYAAKSGHKNLKAIVPQVSPPDPDQNIPYEGGAFLLSAAWWAKALEAIGKGENLGTIKWGERLSVLPLSDLDKTLELSTTFLDEWLAHPPTDAAYWDPQRYQTHYDRMNVAALNISGWYDGDQPGAPQNFIGMRKAGKKNQFLVLGPWGHAFNASRKLGDEDFGPEAVIDLNSVTLRFFDKYLKGIDNGMDAEEPVSVFVMRENKWKQTTDWPLPGTVFTKVHLASNGKANKRDGDGTLSLKPVDGRPDRYVYDPKALPEIPDSFGDAVGASATMDFSKLPDREDVLDYTSPPLADPVELTGPFTAEIWIASDALDADVAVEILRLTPEGNLHGIIGGIQRVRYRTGKDEPAKPGEAVKVTVDCWASSVRLKRGERIRVAVSSNGFPGYSRNLGTLESPATATEAKTATQTILHDAEHPSAVILPVVPRPNMAALKFE